MDRLGFQAPEPGPAPTPIAALIPAPTPPRHQGFWFYGYWGGPGWVSGEWRPESDRIPRPGDPDYRAPMDKIDRSFEIHDNDMNRAHNLEKLPCESDEKFAKRQEAIIEQADARLSFGLKNLPWYYHIGPLNLWRDPAEALFGWGPHKHGYH